MIYNNHGDLFIYRSDILRIRSIYIHERIEITEETVNILLHHILGRIDAIKLVHHTALFKMPEAEVDYGTFLDELYAGNISDVSVTDEEISFLLKEYEGKQILYKTGNMNEPDLTNKLYEAGVNFYKVLPKRQSYLVSLLLTWVLPFLIVFNRPAVFRTLQK